MGLRGAGARRPTCDRVAGCWGSNFYGQLGDGTFNGRDNPSGAVADLPATATSIALGNDHACAISNGDAYCWGDNVHGQLGIGTTTRALLPALVIGLP